MLCLCDTSGKPPHELQKDEVAQTCKKHQSEHWKFPQQMTTLKNNLKLFLCVLKFLWIDCAQKFLRRQFFELRIISKPSV